MFTLHLCLTSRTWPLPSLVPREPRNKTVYGCYVASFPGLLRFVFTWAEVCSSPGLYYCEHNWGRHMNEASCYVCIHYMYMCMFVFYQDSSTCGHVNLTHTLTPHTTTSLALTHPFTFIPPTHTHPHSGGTNYTITGTDLNSVQQPRLLFYMDSAAGEGRTRRQTAGRIMNYIQSEVSMECGSCKPCIFL